MSQSASIRKVNPWHQRLADWLIANPTKTNKEAAEVFDVSESWLSTVKNCDAFQDYFQELSRAHSHAVSDHLAAKTRAVAEMALDELGRRIEKDATVLPFESIKDTADTMLKRAGYGEARASANPVTVNVGLVTRGDLEALRAQMRKETKPIELKALASAPETEAGNA